MESNKGSPKVPSDYPDIPRPSKWEEFVSDIKLVGIAFFIIAANWAIGYFTNG